MISEETDGGPIGLAAQSGGPWGKPGGRGEGDDDIPRGEGEAPPPRNPWLPSGPEEPRRRGPNIEDIFKKGGPARSGGNGGGGRWPGLPTRPDGRSYLPWVVGGLVLLFLLLTSVHRISPQERAVVLLLGKYSRTLEPGVSLSLPWPIETVIARDVQNIRTVDIPDGETEKLILTSDQNLIDLGYSVRWNIRDLKLFEFQLAEPEETLAEVAEAAMRATVAEVSLDDAIGRGRTEIEQRSQQRMQALLNEYRSGIQVQGVAIRKADPPEAVNDAFKEVSAAQQDAVTAINQARAFAQQLIAQAQGESAAFDKVYEEYRLAPDVTRRRLYYETMERVLSKVDKTIVEPGGVTPYLPLNELQRRARGIAAQPPAAPPAAGTQGGGQ